MEANFGGMALFPSPVFGALEAKLQTKFPISGLNRFIDFAGVQANQTKSAPPSIGGLNSQLP